MLRLDFYMFGARSPDLYEGTVESRYTGISLGTARTGRTHAPRGACRSLAEAQRNMLLCCLLTEGLGAVAKRMGDCYQTFLLKTLCLVLERVGKNTLHYCHFHSDRKRFFLFKIYTISY